MSEPWPSAFSGGEISGFKAKCPPRCISLEALNPTESDGAYFLAFWHDGSILLCTYEKRGDVFRTLNGKDILPLGIRWLMPVERV
jgi:hypothetical protein